MPRAMTTWLPPYRMARTVPAMPAGVVADLVYIPSLNLGGADGAYVWRIDEVDLPVGAPPQPAHHSAAGVMGIDHERPQGQAEVHKAARDTEVHFLWGAAAPDR